MEVFYIILSISIVSLLVFIEKKDINIVDFIVIFRMWQLLRFRFVGGVIGLGGGFGVLRLWVKDWMRWIRKFFENFIRQLLKYRLKQKYKIELNMFFYWNYIKDRSCLKVRILCLRFFVYNFKCKNCYRLFYSYQ